MDAHQSLTRAALVRRPFAVSQGEEVEDFLLLPTIALPKGSQPCDAADAESPPWGCNIIDPCSLDV